MYCESCFMSKSVHWFLVDDDSEMQLCAGCVRMLKSEMTIERLVHCS